MCSVTKQRSKQRRDVDELSTDSAAAAAESRSRDRMSANCRGSDGSDTTARSSEP